jgi:hypothetical protein
MRKAVSLFIQSFSMRLPILQKTLRKPEWGEATPTEAEIGCKVIKRSEDYSSGVVITIFSIKEPTAGKRVSQVQERRIVNELVINKLHVISLDNFPNYSGLG